MMQFSVKREALLKPMQLVVGIVAGRSTDPILSHILLIINEKLLTLVGTDIDVEICASTNIEHPIQQVSTEITIPGKKFLEICRALPENSIIELSEESNRIVVSSGKSRFVLTTLPAKNFSRVPEQNKIIEFKVPQNTLRGLIERTSFAIPQQDVRQYLNGLLLEVKDGSIQSLATDGHRLAMSSIAAPVIDNSFAQVIIPRKGIFELLRLLEESDEEVLITFSDNFVRIKSSSFVLTSKLISGKFPNYNKIIPKAGDKVIKIDCDILKKSLMRVGVLSNELFHSVRFQLNSDTLILTSDNSEQEEATEELTVDYSGEPLDSIFNIGYLLDILNVIEAKKISISFKNNDSGALVEELDGGDINCLYVIMPIRRQ